jgi:hypothetical protein
MLMPLIEETATRLQKAPPENLQTGPAVRKDYESIRKHLTLLESYPEIQNLYRTLTEQITVYYNNKPITGEGE